MSQLYANCPPHWNSSDQQISESMSKGLTLKVDSPSQHGTNAHDDQCISSAWGQEGICHKNVGGANPVYLRGTPQEIARSTSQAFMPLPYPSSECYFSGLLAAYGPGSVIQPELVGVTAPRVALPLDISEDEPIYVNAKQYHGILRRRQLRAKLEAQNKLIKNRKPYLHESRHLHALKRVRGSGGRFMSKKKAQQPNSTSTAGHDSCNAKTLLSKPGSQENVTLNFLNGDMFFQHQADHGFLGTPPAHGGGVAQQNRVYMEDSNQHCAPMVQ